MSVRWIRLCLLVGIAVAVWGSGVIPAIIPQAVPTANKLGNGIKFQLSTTGFTPVAGNCATWDASANLVDSGIATCGGAGTSVNSFNGRTGAVVPQTGDYSYSQISGTPTLFYQTVQNAGTPLTQRATINFTGSGISCADSGGITVCTSTGAVSSVFGRTGAVVATSGDYTAAQVTNAAATNTANSFSGTQTVATGNLNITAGTFGLHGLTFSNNNDHSFNVNGTGNTVFSFADSSACSGGPSFNIGGGACGSGGLSAVLGVSGANSNAALGTFLGVTMSGGGYTGTGSNNPGATGSNGGGFSFTGGNGDGFISASTGGNGGSVTLTAGNGGKAAGGGGVNGNGGSITLAPGSAGNGAGTAGLTGKVLLQAHTEFSAITAPSVSSCGSTPSGSLAAGGSDNAGTINVGGGSVTACTLTFGRAFTNAPACIVSTTSTTTTPAVTSVSTAAVTFSFSASVGSTSIYYLCF